MKFPVQRFGDCPNTITGRHEIVAKIGKNANKADICIHCKQIINPTKELKG